MYETDDQSILTEVAETDTGAEAAKEQVRADRAATREQAAPGTGGAIPATVVMTQRCAAALRSCLAENGLHRYRIYHTTDGDVLDAEQFLDALGEAGAAWEPLPPLVPGGRDLAALTHNPGRDTRAWETGVLRLRRHEVIIARWYWLDVHDYGSLRSLRLVAAPSPGHVHALRDAVTNCRRAGAEAAWQIVRGYSYDDEPRLPRPSEVDLILPDALCRTVETDLVRFFNPEVEAIYRELGVPYRRGVLLHGPPGNGKTSLIRLIGARLPKVPVLVLRPDDDFDTGALEEVVRRWTRQAPAILVIEDLNWLLEKVNVSTFLNLLDGIESPATGGLLLIATTNHPDKLDGAVNNRPGRFDVVIEVSPPEKPMRRSFLRRHVPHDVSDETIDALAERSGGLSFAHLQEVLRLSGLNAIHAGRTRRVADDLTNALEAVRQMHEHASSGFPVKLEMPFGLLPLRNAKRAQQAMTRE